MTIERDSLVKVQLSTLLSSILDKLNIKLIRPVDTIDFNERPLLTVEDIAYVGPTAKDYV